MAFGAQLNAARAGRGAACLRRRSWAGRCSPSRRSARTPAFQILKINFFKVNTCNRARPNVSQHGVRARYAAAPARLATSWRIRSTCHCTRSTRRATRCRPAQHGLRWLPARSSEPRDLAHRVANTPAARHCLMYPLAPRAPADADLGGRRDAAGAVIPQHPRRHHGPLARGGGPDDQVRPRGAPAPPLSDIIMQSNRYKIA